MARRRRQRRAAERKGGGVKFRHWLTGEIMGRRYRPGELADTIVDHRPRVATVRIGKRLVTVPPLGTEAFARFEREHAAFIYRGVGPG